MSREGRKEGRGGEETGGGYENRFGLSSGTMTEESWSRKYEKGEMM